MTNPSDRLTRVVDSGNATKGFKYNAAATSPHYIYDNNGNLTYDKHKDLAFVYNYLNLPNSINNSADSYITLTYTADGEKLTKISTAGTRNYVTGIEYLGANLEAIYHSEGHGTPNGVTAFAVWSCARKMTIRGPKNRRAALPNTRQQAARRGSR